MLTAHEPGATDTLVSATADLPPRSGAAVGHAAGPLRWVRTRAVVAGAVALVLGAAATGTMLLLQADTRTDRAALDVARTAATAAATVVDEVVTRRAAAMDALAAAQLEGLVSDAVLATVAEPLGAEAIALVGHDGSVLGAHPPAALSMAPDLLLGLPAGAGGDAQVVADTVRPDGVAHLRVAVPVAGRDGRSRTLVAAYLLAHREGDDAAGPLRAQSVVDAMVDVVGVVAATSGAAIDVAAADGTPVVLTPVEPGPFEATADTVAGLQVRAHGTRGMLLDDGAALPTPASIALVWFGALVLIGAIASTGRAARAAMAARRDAEATARARADFISIASHELRSPVAVVDGMLDLLQRGGGDEAARGRLLDHAVAASKRLRAAVEDVMDVSLADHQDLAPSPAMHGVTSLIADGVASSRLATDATVEVTGAPHVEAWVDQGHIARAIRNLLDNASKYGQPPFEVRAVDHEDGEVSILVVDHGSGLPSGQEAEMFDRYAQGAETPGAETGIGLGLDLCQRLVAANGGSITYRREDERTVFDLRLPARAGAAT